MSCPAVVVDRPGPWPPRRPRSPPPPSPQASTCPYQASSRPRPAPSTTGRSPPRCRHRTTSWRCPSKGRREAVHALESCAGRATFRAAERAASRSSRLQGPPLVCYPRIHVSRPKLLAQTLLPRHPGLHLEVPARPPHIALVHNQAAHLDRRRRRRRRCHLACHGACVGAGIPSRPTLPPPPRGRGGCLGHDPSASSTAATRGGGRRPPGRLSREPRWIGRPSPSRSRCRTGTPRPPRLPLPGDRAAPQLRAWRFFFSETETRDRAGTSAG